MRNYVIINGVNSLTIQGLAINNLPPITKPMIRTQREEIDGRDGDIVTELGYSAYDKQIEIGLWGTYDINDIIKYFTGEGTIVFSNEEDKYYNFKILDQIDYEKLLKFKTATITLHCQPFKYPLEEEPVEAEITTLTGTGENITLEDTEEAPMEIDLKGNTSQEGTPTPDAPQDIHVVSGDNSINVVGKNLFTLKKISNATTLGVERTINNSELKLNGTSSGAGRVIGRQTTGIILPSGTYSVLVQKKSGNVTPNGKYTVFYFRKPDGTEITALNINNYSGNYSFKTTFVLSGETELYVEIYCTEAGYTLDNLELQFYIESGYNLTPTYEAYIEESYPINLPVENLFELPTTQTINGITFTNNGNGTFNLSGTASAITDFVISRELSTIGNGSYTISSKSTGYSLMLAFYNGNTWLSTPINKLPTDLIKTGNITIPSNATKYDLVIRVSSGSTINLINETVQFEKGSKANSYTPYGTTPIELCKIGSYQDYFYKDSDKWYLHKEIGKVVLNGSESNWNVVLSSNLYRFEKVFNILPYTDTSRHIGRFICSHFYPNTNNEIGVIFQYQSTVLFYAPSGITTVEQWKTWLGNNNTTLYYVLATPTYTKITDAKLIEELDSVELQKGINNISLVGSITPDLKIDYRSDVPNYEFETSDYSSLEGSLTKYGPVNCVLLGSENISGENVYLQDDESISKNGETKVLIDSQYFLYTQALREQAIQGVYKKLHNFEYYDLSLTTYYGKPFLEVGNKIRVNTNEGNAYDTFILQHTFTYDGTFKSVIKSPALTKQEEIVKSTESVSNRLKHTEIMVDKANQKITSVVEDVAKLDSKTTKIEQNLDSVSITVSQTETKVEDLEDSIEYFNVSMLQETVVIPVYSNKKPYSTTTYSIDYTAKFKNATVTPTVQISGTEAGVTTSSTSSQIKFAVDSSTAIANNDYTYTIGFSYTSEGTTYTSTKKITVALSIQGEQGGSGKGISSITEEFYLSTSKTSQTGGSWVTTPPTWVSGKYIWTRSKIVYTNPSSTVYTTPLCSSEWEAVNGISVGGRNLLLKSKDLSGTPSKTDRYVTVYNSTKAGRDDGFVASRLDTTDSFKGITFKGESLGLNVGDEITYSFDIESVGYSSSINFFALIYNSGGTRLQGGYFELNCDGRTVTDSSIDIGTITAGEKRRINIKIRWLQAIQDVIDNGGTVNMTIQTHSPITLADSESHLDIYAPKVEKGNQATDWTPAPEDEIPIYTHTMFSENGTTFVPEYNEYDEDDPTIIVTHYPIGKKPSRYQGTLVDNNVEDSSTFGDYNWIDTSQYNREEINELQETLSTTVTTVSGLKETLDGLTNTITSSGGTNLVRDSMGVLNDGSWEGNVESTNFSTSVGQSAIVVNNNTISQTINVKNGLYTLSLKYRKNANIATGRMNLTVAGVTTQFSESNENGNGYVQQINVTTGTISLSIKGNADNIGYVYDLMLNAGSEVKSWEQNQNETTTDTVKIGKGIEVSSSSQNTTTRMDAGGFRVFSNSSGDVVMEATDKGGSFVELVSSSTSNINGSMFIKVGSQIWETGVSS